MQIKSRRKKQDETIMGELFTFIFKKYTQKIVLIYLSELE